MARVKLGDVAREYKATCGDQKEGLRVVGLEHLIPQQIILTLWDEGKENTFTKMFKKGQVLFGRRRAYLKKAAVAPFDGICSGDITVIEAIPSKIIPELLPFIIQNDTLFDFAVERSAGSLSPRVKWEHLKNFEFELPELDKQKELADILWASERAKTAYRDLISSTDELVKSQFIEMFGDWRYNPFHLRQVLLGSVCNVLNGFAFQSKKYVGSGIRIIRITNVQKGFVEDTDPQFYPIELESELKPYILVEGDVLLSLTGNVGRVGQLPKELLPAGLNQRVACLRVDDTQLNREFLFYMLNTSIFENDCIESSSGIAQKNMSTEWLKKYKIILPEIDMQLQFVEVAKQIDKSKSLRELTVQNQRMGGVRCA